ncbi:MAG: GAF domain-containing sensor histidine kinase [Anaerolineae bacterium]|nr:GAF domain-containing sensor histidine kinase [Anaerolineae bacterium]
MNSETNAEKLKRRNRELSILNEIAQGLNQSLDLNQAVQSTLAQVANLLNLQTGWVWLLQEDGETSYLAATLNLPPALAQKPARMEGDCYCLRTFREGDLAGAANVNVVECSRLHGLVDGTDGLRYHASIPLYAHGKKLGVLNVASQDWRGLSEDDLKLLYTVGDLLGIAVERARLYEQSVQLGAVRERNRLAREIHDTLAQGLTAVSLQLESADILLETGTNPEKAHLAVQQALSLTRANLDEARRSVMDLRAAPLEGRTLAEALTALAHTLDDLLDIHTTITGAGRPLSPRIEIGLYRIAQEALTNIRRHAQATEAKLTLVITPKSVKLTVVDNGRGFDTEAVPNGRFGLIGMNERVKLLGGSFTLESHTQVGTEITVTIPLN